MSAQLGIPPAALATLKESLTCLLLGTVVATGVYGITVLQAYTYFRHAGQRSTGADFCPKVAMLFILDTLSMILNVDGLYDYVIRDYGNPILLLKVPGTLAFENGVTASVMGLSELKGVSD
uniref:Tetrahydroxynaphthalene reductase (THNR)) n=1 Tax=Ganoderma boninense TaxID=34458 RepID=A0A5K1K264_9APHY|nr:Tetrahydroxynaphthalene reductase (EC (T4HN reductase) (THNR) [Ganoderma boninense]